MCNSKVITLNHSYGIVENEKKFGISAFKQNC